MKKWVGLGVLGVFASFIAIMVIIFSHLTKALESDIFDIDSTEEELF